MENFIDSWSDFADLLRIIYSCVRISKWKHVNILIADTLALRV